MCEVMCEVVYFKTRVHNSIFTRLYQINPVKGS